MNQNVWGSSFWFTLENICFNYPIQPNLEDKKNMKSFIDTIQYVLPCGICRKNFKIELEQRPLQLNSRKELVYWLHSIHNDVNSRTGKRLYTFQEAINEYEKRIGGKVYLGDDPLEVEKIKQQISEIDKKFYVLLTTLIILIIILLNFPKYK